MASHHKRNTGPMRDAPRCGARTRSGGECASPKVSGSARCRMHGGRGSGAPKSNRNAHKHGLYTAKMCQHRRQVAGLLRAVREIEAEIEEDLCERERL